MCDALAVSGGTLYAGGNFTTAGGKVSAYVAEAYLVAPPGGLVDSIVVPSSGTADVRCYGNPGQQFGVQRTTESFAAALDQRELQPAHPRGGRLLHLCGHQRSPRRRFLPRIPILTPHSRRTTN